MEEKKDIEEIFSKSVSEIGKELFSEYLSDESRKRQTNLLLSSVVAILLSSTLVTPTQISIGAITTDSVNSQLFIFLSGLTCLYFITIYILSVMQDLEVYKFRKMPLTIILRDLKEKIYDAEKVYLDEMNKAHALIEESEIRRIAMSEIGDELKSRLGVKTDKPKSHAKGTENGFVAVIRTTEDPALQKTIAEIDSVMENLYQTIKPDGVDEVFEQQKVLMNKTHELFNKELLLLNMKEKYDRLNKIKMFIEVGFPILLGIAGIGLTLFALLK